MAIEKFERYTHDSLTLGKQDPLGNLFIGSDSHYADLAHVKILHQGVDTIRQLYCGKLLPEFLQYLEETYERGKNALGSFFGHDFCVNSAGSKSGFRYRLQNNELGLIVFVGNYYKDLDYEGTHLKIEVSPHLIIERGHDAICDLLASIAKECFGYAYSGVGCALHLCVDVQGWDIPYDMEQRFITRSRKVFRINGLSDIDFDSSAISARYNRSETVTFGSAKRVQVSFYDKTAETRKKDKLHYWEKIWGSSYDKSQSVKRIELRMHHLVTREFGNYQQELDGTSYDHKFETFRELKDYLPQIWQSMLLSNRLNYRNDSNLIDPFWQMLMEDVTFSCPPYTGKPYKRLRKSHRGAERNVAMYIGNSLSLFARKNFSGSVAYQFYCKSGLIDEIQGYYRDKGLDEQGFIRWLDEMILQRRYLRNAA